MLAIDPLSCHRTVSTWLHRRSIFTRVDDFSAGPRTQGASSSTFFPVSFSFLCTIESFTLSSADVTNFLLFERINSLTFYSSSLPYQPSLPPRLVFSSHVVARVLFQSRCLRGLPPFRTSPSENVFQAVDHRIGSLVTDPSHSLPHTIGSHLIQTG